MQRRGINLEKLIKMREIVKTELLHIPKWDVAQNELRMFYWFLRMHSLGSKTKQQQTKEQILREAIQDVKKRHPDFKPRYDETFFGSIY